MRPSQRNARTEEQAVFPHIRHPFLLSPCLGRKTTHPLFLMSQLLQSVKGPSFPILIFFFFFLPFWKKSLSVFLNCSYFSYLVWPWFQLQLFLSDGHITAWNSYNLELDCVWLSTPSSAPPLIHIKTHSSCFQHLKIYWKQHVCFTKISNWGWGWKPIRKREATSCVATSKNRTVVSKL